MVRLHLHVLRIIDRIAQLLSPRGCGSQDLNRQIWYADFRYMERVQKSKQAITREQETVSEETHSVDADEIKARTDEILDEIDELLEENAEEFIRGFIQKGGE